MQKSSLIFSILCLSCVLFLWSCRKDKNEPVTDNVIFGYNGDADIPADAVTAFAFFPPGFYAPAFSQDFASNTVAELAKKGYTTDQIVAFKGNSLVVSVTNNPGQTLDFMDTLKVFVKQKNATDSVLFAYSYNYPLGLRTLPLDMVDVDVKNIFSAEYVTMSLGGTKRAGNHSIQANTHLDFQSTVKVTVEVTP